MGGCPHVLMKAICAKGVVMFARSWNCLDCELKCVFRIISVGVWNWVVARLLTELVEYL